MAVFALCWRLCDVTLHHLLLPLQSCVDSPRLFFFFCFKPAVVQKIIRAEKSVMRMKSSIPVTSRCVLKLQKAHQCSSECRWCFYFAEWAQCPFRMCRLRRCWLAALTADVAPSLQIWQRCFLIDSRFMNIECVNFAPKSTVQILGQSDGRFESSVMNTHTHTDRQKFVAFICRWCGHFNPCVLLTTCDVCRNKCCIEGAPPSLSVLTITVTPQCSCCCTSENETWNKSSSLCSLPRSPDHSLQSCSGL